MQQLYSTYYQSPVGLLHITGSSHYINSICFIDTLENPVPQQPCSMIIQCVEQLIQYFNGERRKFEFPIHQTGTPFQEKVWDELLGIPFGKTISYLELARRLGDTKVIRASASAIGKNNLAIVVPCHRVIGSNNEMIGYGGGRWRKKWLLDHEMKVSHGVQTLF